MPTTDEQPPVLLTVKQAGARLNLSNPKLYELINSGELRSIKVGRARRIPTFALEEFVEGRLDPDGSNAA